MNTLNRDSLIHNILAHLLYFSLYLYTFHMCVQAESFKKYLRHHVSPLNFSAAISRNKYILLNNQKLSHYDVVVQSLSRVRLFVTPWTAACQASLSIINSWSLLKFRSIESVLLSNHLILSYPLLLLPSVYPSIRVFSSKSALCIRWPKYWSFSFSMSPFNEYSGLISLRTDWFDLLAFQGILKSLLRHHILKASIIQFSAFFMVQLSHPYMTTGKTIALTIRTFVDKGSTF